MKQTAGVYKITIGDEFYIGSSVNIEARTRQHKASLRAGRSPQKLQAAYNKYGELHVDILEVAADNMTAIDLLRREQFYYEELNPQLNGKPPIECSVGPESEIELAALHMRWCTRDLKNETYSTERKLKSIERTARILLHEVALSRKYLRTVGELRDGRKSKKDQCKEARN